MKVDRREGGGGRSEALQGQKLAMCMEKERLNRNGKIEIRANLKMRLLGLSFFFC